MAHDYQITKNGQTIVNISKEWMTWGDSYELDITVQNSLVVDSGWNKIFKGFVPLVFSF